MTAEAKRIFMLINTFLAIIVLTSCSTAQDTEKPAEKSGLKEITIFQDNKHVKVNAEIAGTQKERGKGLMGRKDLGSNRGMLFVFEKE